MEAAVPFVKGIFCVFEICPNILTIRLLLIVAIDAGKVLNKDWRELRALLRLTA